MSIISVLGALAVSPRYLIIGLGNPGAEYEWTRHNLGFMLVDRLAREAGAEVGIKRKECRALIGRAQLEGQAVELVKPQTFMNLSGESVECLLRKRQMEAARNLIVASDDLALPLGTIRLRANGSSGGHNGLRSIIAATKTSDFMRLRIGIGPEHPISDTARFVLDKFSLREREQIDKILERSAEALRAVLREGIVNAMSKYN